MTKAKKNIADPEFEKLVAKDFTRIPRNFWWAYTWVTRYLLRYEAAVFQAIICATWGWNRTEDWVDIDLISRHSGIVPQNIYRSLAKLILYQMVEKKESKYGKVFLRIQNDYRQWRVVTKTGYIDFRDIKERKLYPSQAERAHYRQLDQWNATDEID